MIGHRELLYLISETKWRIHCCTFIIPTPTIDGTALISALFAHHALASQSPITINNQIQLWMKTADFHQKWIAH